MNHTYTIYKYINNRIIIYHANNPCRGMICKYVFFTDVVVLYICGFLQYVYILYMLYIYYTYNILKYVYLICILLIQFSQVFSSYKWPLKMGQADTQCSLILDLPLVIGIHIMVVHWWAFTLHTGRPSDSHLDLDLLSMYLTWLVWFGHRLYYDFIFV